MKRLLPGMVPLLAILIGVSCSSEPTGDLRNGVDELVATPDQLFIELGASKTVEVGGIDAQGNPQSLDYQVTAVGNGITVKRDSTFRPNFVNDSTLEVPSEGPSFRFIVTATDYTATSFTVAGGGKSIDIGVQVVPQNAIAATFSDSTPALGDTITITAPAGTTFSPTANIFFGDTLAIATIVDRDPNGQSIRFIAPPSVNGPVGISAVTSASAPTLEFRPLTTAILTTPLVDTVDVSYSTVTPTLGQTVTMTIVQDPAHIKFATIDSLTYPGQLAGSAAGPAAIAVAPDSTSLTFQAPPNAAGSGVVTSFVFPGGYVLALPTRPTITAQNIGTTINATFSTLTPNALDPVTLTMPAGFKLGPLANDTVVIGGNPAILQSAAADGSSITFLPIPGSVGIAQISGISPTAAPQFVLTMSTVQSITVPALVPLAGTDAPATAPLITVPGTLIDAGTFAATDCGQNSGVPCQLYKISLSAPTTLHFTLSGSNLADLGLYFINAGDLSDAAQVCDALGRDSPPEDCTLAFAAGDYLMAVVNFGPFYPELDPNPAFIKVEIQ
jgi:hypothetical protein